MTTPPIPPHFPPEHSAAAAPAVQAPPGASLPHVALASEGADAPLRSLRYRQTRDDVAACERLPREMVGWETLFLFGPALLGGMAWGVFSKEIGRHLPVDPRGPWAFPLVLFGLIAVAYASSALMRCVRTWWRIRTARLPGTETVIEAWLDHFTVTEDHRTRSYAWEMVRVGGSESHVFLWASPRDVVTLPLRAFRTAEDMRSFLDFAECAGRVASEDGCDEDDAAGSDEAAQATPGANDQGRPEQRSRDNNAPHEQATKGARP